MNLGGKAVMENQNVVLMVNTHNPDIHNRRSIRLKFYDYTQAGAYFVTICTHDRECLFGFIGNSEMVLNEYGRIVDFTWNDLVNHNINIGFGEYVIMPNHFHGIIVINPVGVGSKPTHSKPVRNSNEAVGAGSKPALVDGAGLPRAGLEPAPTNHGLPEIVRQFKTFSARRINEMRHSPGVPVWQRNYYEHVIRNEADYNRIAEYVAINPRKWLEDTLHPENAPSDVGAGSKPAQPKPAQPKPAKIFRKPTVAAGSKPAQSKPSPNIAVTSSRAGIAKAGLEPAPTGFDKPDGDNE